MTATVAGALLTAGALGVTHAIEPDHVAGISSLTSRYGDSRLSALVGACFSLGHVALVVVWLAVGYVLLGQTTFPPVYDTVGTLGVAVLLGVLGAAMTVGGLRSVIHAHEHEHDGEHHSHAHLHLPGFGSSGHDHGNEHPRRGHAPDGEHERDPEHDHGHGTVQYLKTGLVGALFTLSPPASMIAFSATLFPTYGASVVAGAVLAYAVAITATMSALGAGIGAVFGSVGARPRIYGAARAAAGLAVVAIAATVFLGAVPSLT